MKLILKNILNSIQSELLTIEKGLSKIINQVDNPELLGIAKYTDKSLRGKRLRPALFILSAKAANTKKRLRPKQRDDILNGALAIEFSHLASLVHDDIIDESPTRHDLPTIYKKYGRDQTIVLGDRLIALSFESLAVCSDRNVRQIITRSLRDVCDGQLIQILNRNNFSLTREEYNFIIKKKTAAFFIGACRAGSCLSNKKFTVPLSKYALNLGIAFQIINDTEDILAKKQSLGEDIKMGEITLPLILFRDSLSEKQKAVFKKTLASQDKDSRKKIKKELLNSSAVYSNQKIILNHLARARQSLATIPNSPYKQGLDGLALILTAKANELS